MTVLSGYQKTNFKDKNSEEFEHYQKIKQFYEDVEQSGKNSKLRSVKLRGFFRVEKPL